jgi:hypothetical protein
MRKDAHNMQSTGFGDPLLQCIRDRALFSTCDDVISLAWSITHTSRRCSLLQGRGSGSSINTFSGLRRTSGSPKRVSKQVAAQKKNTANACHLYLWSFTERCNRVVSTPASYSGGSGFKSQPRDRLA